MDEGGDITLHGAIAGGQPIKVSWLHNGESKDPDGSGVSIRAAAEDSLLVCLVLAAVDRHGGQFWAALLQRQGGEAGGEGIPA